MFAFAKLKSDAQSFVTQISSSGRSRRKAAAIALARMVASQFTIPSAPVSNIEQEYRNVCQLKAEKDISAINEIVPIDLNYALDICRAYYLFRYRNVHPSDNVFSFRPEKFVEDFFDISRVFSDETLEVIKQDGNDLAFFANGFRKVLNDVKAADDAQAAQMAAA